MDERLRHIKGSVLEDSDNDDISELGLSGVSVALVDPTDGITVATAGTGGSAHSVIAAEPGVYILHETTPYEYVDVSE